MENTTQPIQPITVADLDALRSIIDLAATRGAFQGAELSQVGAVFDKLTTFLNSVVKQAQASAEPLSDNTQGV
jgi:uncharacterized protein YggE